MSNNTIVWAVAHAVIAVVGCLLICVGVVGARSPVRLAELWETLSEGTVNEGLTGYTACKVRTSAALRHEVRLAALVMVASGVVILLKILQEHLGGAPLELFVLLVAMATFNALIAVAPRQMLRTLGWYESSTIERWQRTARTIAVGGFFLLVYLAGRSLLG